MAHIIKWEEKGVIVNYQSIVNIKDIVQSNYSMFNDIRLDKIDYKIIDFLRVSNIYLDKQDVIVAATLNNVSVSWEDPVKFAIVTKDEYLQEISGVFFEKLDEAVWDGKIFSTLAEARGWIFG